MQNSHPSDPHESTELSRSTRAENASAHASDVAVAYRTLTAHSIAACLQHHPGVVRQLGGPASRWRAREQGDGNLNLVFLVQGPLGEIIVKQALPYVRMIGESWPLALARSHFERAALQEQSRWAEDYVPCIYDADDGLALIAMQYLTPHIVLRKAMIQGRVFPLIGQHLGIFLARVLFNTSDLRLTGDVKKRRVADFAANSAMCKITEDLVFDEPYFAAPMNRHTRPLLDGLVAEIAHDVDLIVAVQEMKWRFMNQPECMLHGDLHTGSVMATQTDTRVIDPEFAFYGPMGFDVGMLLGNFLMAFFSQSGHEARAGERNGYCDFLLEQISVLWTTFVREFSALWRARRPDDAGQLYHPRLGSDPQSISQHALDWYVQRIWLDALGFAGCEMIRRVVGLSHVEDFENIADPHLRACCEQRAVALARQMLMQRLQFASCLDLASAARKLS